MSTPLHQDQDGDRRVNAETSTIWERALLLLVLGFGFGLAQSLLFVLAMTQFLWMLIGRERNRFLADFGRSLGLWMAETAWFLSADTDEKPFPWREWPRS